MNYNILITPKFSKKFKQLKKKYKKIKEDLEACIHLLQENPFAGTSMGKGLYKLRLKSSDISRGKSGGFRIIYYVVTEDEELYLLTIYSKAYVTDISIDKLREILEESGLIK